MLIYPLWLVSYHSGTGEQFFKSAMQNIGATVNTCPLDIFGSEYRLMDMLCDNSPDLIFHVPYKDTFRTEVMRKLTEKGYPTLCWNGDDESLWFSDHYHNPGNISKDYRWVVTTHDQAVEKYKKMGIKPVLAQWGYSGKDWTRGKRKRDIDVYCCGASTDERDRFINRIKGMPINYSFDGPGYGVHADKKNRTYKVMESHGKPTPGKVPFPVMLSRYQRAKISVSFLMGYAYGRKYTQVKARAFEIPAAGAFQLAYHCDELNRFFEIGKEIDTFLTEEEMCDKIKFYLKHDSLREKMADRAHRRNIDYSYENILKRIFKEIGI